MIILMGKLMSWERSVLIGASLNHMEFLWEFHGVLWDTHGYNHPLGWQKL